MGTISHEAMNIATFHAGRRFADVKSGRIA